MPYTRPKDVISPKKNWTLIEVLDEGSEGTSALALGRWSDGRRNPPVLAMRWNGHDSRPSGNPQSRGLPTWFVVEEKYYECIMRSGLLAPDKLTLVRSFFPEK
jgi:hypothetical protein